MWIKLVINIKTNELRRQGRVKLGVFFKINLRINCEILIKKNIRNTNSKINFVSLPQIFVF